MNSVPVSLHLLIPWLVDFSKAADNIDVVFDKQALVEKLESFGYVANMHVIHDENKDAADNWDRKTLGEYIVGQAINCLKHKMPPHPVIEKFAKEFMEHPDETS